MEQIITLLTDKLGSTFEFKLMNYDKIGGFQKFKK